MNKYLTDKKETEAETAALFKKYFGSDYGVCVPTPPPKPRVDAAIPTTTLHARNTRRP